MIQRRSLALLLGVVAVATACRQSPEAVAAQAKAIGSQRAKALTRRLASAAANPEQNKPVALWVMPTKLREISGLALMSNGQLLAHGDELALIYIIDPRTGIVLERFHVGKRLHGDFEGITTAGNDIWLLQSNGRLYRFRLGTNGAHVPYTVHDTRLGKECEFEGIAYEPDSAWLVLPCKRATKKSMRDQLVIYRMRLLGAEAGTISEFTVPMDQVIGSNKWKSFRTSDIAIDPNTGNYVLIASQEKGLAVITPEGEVLRSEPLPGQHPQAEGVAITPDNILIVSDEATNTPARITLYRWRP